MVSCICCIFIWSCGLYDLFGRRGSQIRSLSLCSWFFTTHSRGGRRCKQQPCHWTKDFKKRPDFHHLAFVAFVSTAFGSPIARSDRPSPSGGIQGPTTLGSGSRSWIKGETMNRDGDGSSFPAALRNPSGSTLRVFQTAPTW